MQRQGANATLAAALPAAAAAAGGEGVAPCCLGLLFRFLRRLPEPAFAFASYEAALNSTSAQLPALLRALPEPHARLLQAVGELFAALLRHCAIDAAAPTASQQTHVQSLLAALAPSLLWPAPRQTVPKLERPQAVAATRHLLHYYAQARSPTQPPQPLAPRPSPLATRIPPPPPPPPPPARRLPASPRTPSPPSPQMRSGSSISISLPPPCSPTALVPPPTAQMPRGQRHLPRSPACSALARRRPRPPLHARLRPHSCHPSRPRVPPLRSWLRSRRVARVVAGLRSG